jgi:hypothetical protein
MMNEPSNTHSLVRGDRIVTNQDIDMNGPIIPRGTTGLVANVAGNSIQCRFDRHQGTWGTSARTLDRSPDAPAQGATGPEEDHNISELVSVLATGNQYVVTRTHLDAIKRLPIQSKAAFVASIVEQLRDQRFQDSTEWSYETNQVAEFFAVGLAVSGPACIDTVIQYGEAEFHRKDSRLLAARTLGNVAKRNDPATIPPEAAQRAVSYLMKVISSGDPLEQMVWGTVETLAHFGPLAHSARELVAATSDKIDRYEHSRVLDIYQNTLLRIGG